MKAKVIIDYNREYREKLHCYKMADVRILDYIKLEYDESEGNSIHAVCVKFLSNCNDNFIQVETNVSTDRVTEFPIRQIAGAGSVAIVRSHMAEISWPPEVRKARITVFSEDF
jgi:phosphoribosylformylglycinamidine (FGAM) synthase PurS component